MSRIDVNLQALSLVLPTHSLCYNNDTWPTSCVAGEVPMLLINLDQVLSPCHRCCLPTHCVRLECCVPGAMLASSHHVHMCAVRQPWASICDPPDPSHLIIFHSCRRTKLNFRGATCPRSDLHLTLLTRLFFPSCRSAKLNFPGVVPPAPDATMLARLDGTYKPPVNPGLAKTAPADKVNCRPADVAC